VKSALNRLGEDASPSPWLISRAFTSVIQSCAHAWNRRRRFAAIGLLAATALPGAVPGNLIFRYSGGEAIETLKRAANQAGLAIISRSMPCGRGHPPRAAGFTPRQALDRMVPSTVF
jgi:uncharacterized membrane protein YfcA